MSIYAPGMAVLSGFVHTRALSTSKYGMCGDKPERFIKGVYRIGEQYVDSQVIWAYAQDFCGGLYVASPNVRISDFSALDFAIDDNWRFKGITKDRVRELPDAGPAYLEWCQKFPEHNSVKAFAYAQLALLLADVMLRNRTMRAMGSMVVDSVDSPMAYLVRAWGRVSGLRTPLEHAFENRMTDHSPLQRQLGAHSFVRTSSTGCGEFGNPNSGNMVEWVQLCIDGTDFLTPPDDDWDEDYETESVREQYAEYGDHVPSTTLRPEEREELDRARHVLPLYIDRYEWRNG